MKFDDMVSTGHNIADSLGSGASLVFNAYGYDIYADAAGSDEGHLVVDFLAGRVVKGVPSSAASRMASRAPDMLDELCRRAGVDAAAFAELTARYGTDRVYGRHFTVTVRTTRGRLSVDTYSGSSGKRMRRAARKLAPVESTTQKP